MVFFFGGKINEQKMNLMKFRMQSKVSERIVATKKHISRTRAKHKQFRMANICEKYLLMRFIWKQKREE